MLCRAVLCCGFIIVVWVLMVCLDACVAASFGVIV